MGDYISGLMIISVVATVLCFIVPNDSLGRHQKFVAGLCIICVAIKPVTLVAQFIQDFDINLYLPQGDSEKYEDMWDKYTEQYTEQTLKNYIESELEESFAVKADKIMLTCSDDGENVKVDKIYIQLPRECVFKDTDKIRVHFMNIFACEVTVAIS